MIPKYALSDIKILQYDSVVTFIVYIFFSEYAAIYATTKTEDWTPDEDWYSINDIDDPEEQELEKENYYDWNYQPDIIVQKAYITPMNRVSEKDQQINLNVYY